MARFNKFCKRLPLLHRLSFSTLLRSLSFSFSGGQISLPTGKKKGGGIGGQDTVYQRKMNPRSDLEQVETFLWRKEKAKRDGIAE